MVDGWWPKLKMETHRLVCQRRAASQVGAQLSTVIAAEAIQRAISAQHERIAAAAAHAHCAPIGQRENLLRCC